VILPSVAAMVYVPGPSSVTPRRIKAEASTWASRALNCAGRPNTIACSLPLTVTRASPSAMTPSNSTLRSNRDPARISARSTGYTVSAVAPAGERIEKATQVATRVEIRVIVMACLSGVDPGWSDRALVVIAPGRRPYRRPITRR
jgi:hypothetical protein